MSRCMTRAEIIHPRNIISRLPRMARFFVLCMPNKNLDSYPRLAINLDLYIMETTGLVASAVQEQ
jgi:hypothetical protein